MKCEEEDEEQDVEDEEMYDERMNTFREFVGKKFVQVKSESESDFLFICKVTEGKMGNDSSDESMRLFIG